MARAWMRWWFGVSGFMFGLVAAVVLGGGAAVMYWQGRSQVQAHSFAPPTVYCAP